MRPWEHDKTWILICSSFSFVTSPASRIFKFFFKSESLEASGEDWCTALLRELIGGECSGALAGSPLDCDMSTVGFSRKWLRMLKWLYKNTGQPRAAIQAKLCHFSSLASLDQFAFVIGSGPVSSFLISLSMCAGQTASVKRSKINWNNEMHDTVQTHLTCSSVREHIPSSLFITDAVGFSRRFGCLQKCFSGVPLSVTVSIPPNIEWTVGTRQKENPKMKRGRHRSNWLTDRSGFQAGILMTPATAREKGDSCFSPWTRSGNTQRWVC